jgi:hypothetical protein
MATNAVARINVRYGRLAEFNDAMERVLPIMADRGWRLLASYQTLIGNFHEVYDIWELPSADGIAADMLAAAMDPRFVGIGEALARSVESETLSVVGKTPFSP